MSDDRFDVVFRGDIASGHTLPQVKLRMAALFKRDAAQIEPLFSGAPVPLKKAIDHASAEKYKKVLEQAGALVEIRAAGTLKSPPARSPMPKAPTTMPETPEMGAHASGLSAPKVKTTLAEPEATPNGLSLVPMEGYLLTEAERKSAEVAPVQVNNLDLVLRPLDGPLVDEDEIDRLAPVSVPELEFDLAESGADIIEPQYRVVEAPLAVADLQVDLAPVGSELGQIPKEPAPPPPDVSAITLVD